MSTSTKHHRPKRAVIIRLQGQNGGSQVHKGDVAPPRNIHNNRIGQVTIARGTAHITNLGLSAPKRRFAVGISAQTAISATTIQSSLDNRNTDARSSSNCSFASDPLPPVACVRLQVLDWHSPQPPVREHLAFDHRRARSQEIYRDPSRLKVKINAATTSTALSISRERSRPARLWSG